MYISLIEAGHTQNEIDDMDLVQHLKLAGRKINGTDEQVDNSVYKTAEDNKLYFDQVVSSIE